MLAFLLLMGSVYWIAPCEAGELRHSALQHSIEAFSAKFLGRPYVGGPLGEDGHDDFDKDPLVRFDVFDCMTYVETVMALSISKTPSGLSGFEDHLRRIRYEDGRISYVSRNHFAELDWIPNNTEAGYVTDITRQIAGDEVRIASALLDKKSWYENRGENDIQPPGRDAAEVARLVPQLKALGAKYLPQSASVVYIPSARIFKSDGVTPDREFLDRIPSGSIANVVRENWKPPGVGTPLLISHQGFLIRKGEVLHFRHAAQGRRVLDVPLTEYLGGFVSSPTIRGFNVLRVEVR